MSWPCFISACVQRLCFLFKKTDPESVSIRIENGKGITKVELGWFLDYGDLMLRSPGLIKRINLLFILHRKHNLTRRYVGNLVDVRFYGVA